ncbi:MAG TPA: hypothetical protein VK928_09870 [Longimicrobiales bacterium]|nr:hypothetical protein [Longimicrobiales bacterium]
MTRSLIILAAALLACSGTGDDDAPDDASHVLTPPPTAAGDSALAGFIDNALELPGRTRAELAARLGEPDSTSARTVENRHDPSVTDSVLTLHYPGLVAEIYRAGYDGKEILASVEVSDAVHLRPMVDAGIGTSADAVRAALGEPATATATLLEYVCDECLVSGHETVRFTLEEGIVRRIHIQYWVD